MKSAALAFGVACAALAGTAPGARSEASGAAESLVPFQMVRSLQLVQDRVASGDHAALPIQRKLLEMIDMRMRAASAAEMMQPQNFRSMMVYAMSGGNPATLTSVLFRLHLNEKENQIAGAVLAYLRGSPNFATAALKGIDPMQEPEDIGAFLALVKGSVTSQEDPKTALKLLDQARLLSPGTLVEEAALRRSVGLTTTLNDPARFTLAIDQYVRSYLRSPYASQFADALVAGVVEMRETLDLEAIAAIIAMMNPDQRKVIYLRIARRAAIDGLVALSQFASEKAKAVDLPGDGDSDPRILLYTSLTSVTTESADLLKEKISRIDRSRLSAGDQELLDAVSMVSSEIIESPGLEVAGHDLTPAPAETTLDAPRTIDAPAPPPEMAAHEPATPAVPATSADAISRAEPPTPQMQADAAASSDATTAADSMVADGRKKLAEIDDLLAGAAE